MAEFLTMNEANEKYASTGKGNAGLALGIIGTALGALAYGGGNIFGGGNSGMPSAYEVQQKQCADNIALTNSIWQTRVTDLQEKFDLYTRLSDRINGLEKTEAATAAALPLMFQLSSSNSERYTDDKLHRAEAVQTAINFGLQNEIAKKINGTMGLPMADLITGVPTMPALQYSITGCNGGTTS